MQNFFHAAALQRFFCIYVYAPVAEMQVRKDALDLVQRLARGIERLGHEFEHEIAVFAVETRGRLMRLHRVNQRRVARLETVFPLPHAQVEAALFAVKQLKMLMHVRLRGHAQPAHRLHKALAHPAQIHLRADFLQIILHTRLGTKLIFLAGSLYHSGRPYAILFSSN